MFHELLKMVQEEKEEITRKLNEKNQEAIFLKHLQETTKFMSLNNIEKMNLCDLCVAYLRATDHPFSFQEAYDAVSTSSRFIAFCDDRTYVTTIFMLKVLLSVYDYKEAKKLLDLKYQPSSSDFLSMSGGTKNLLIRLRSIEEKYRLDLSGVAYLIKKDSSLYDDVLPFIHACRMMQQEKREFSKLISSMREEGLKISSKSEEKKFLDFLKNGYHVKNIMDYFDQIKKYAEKVLYEEKTSRKRLSREFTYYGLLESFMKNYQNGDEIYSIPKEILKISNETLKISFLRKIYDNNMAIYQKQKERYDLLSKDSYNQYKILFQKFDLDLSCYSIDKEASFSEVEEVLTKLFSLGLANKGQILDILNSSDIHSIYQVFQYSDAGYFDFDFIKNHLAIFSKISILSKNIEHFQERGVSISIIRQLEQCLLDDPSILSTNLEVLSQYDLLKYLKKTQDASFFGTKQLEEKVDRVLEVGLEDTMREGLDLLHYTTDSFLKVILGKRLGISMDDTTQLETILANKRINVQSNELSDFLYNEAFYIDSLEGEEKTKNEFLTCLRLYSSTGRTYSLDGVILSKNKILRNLNEMEDQLSPIDQFRIMTSGMILDHEECQKVISCVISSDKKIMKKR